MTLLDEQSVFTGWSVPAASASRSVRQAWCFAGRLGRREVRRRAELSAMLRLWRSSGSGDARALLDEQPVTKGWSVPAASATRSVRQAWCFASRLGRREVRRRAELSAMLRLWRSSGSGDAMALLDEQPVFTGLSVPAASASRSVRQAWCFARRLGRREVRRRAELSAMLRLWRSSGSGDAMALLDEQPVTKGWSAPSPSEPAPTTTRSVLLARRFAAREVRRPDRTGTSGCGAQAGSVTR